MRVPATSPLRRALSFATFCTLSAAFVQCNTYSAELLLDEPVDADPEPSPDGDDDSPPVVTVGPSPEPECPSLPCDPVVEPPGPEPGEPSVEPAMPPVGPVTPGTSVGPAPTSPGPDGSGGDDPTGTGGSTGGSGSPTGGTPGTPAGSAGTSGGSSTAGAGAEPEPSVDGGAGGAVVVVPDPVSPLLIEDFEDGNNTLLRNEDRRGYWYTAGAEDGMLTPVPMEFETADVDPPNASLEDSAQALHFVATGFAGDETSWALVGVALNDGEPYATAAEYAGIVVWARSTTASATVAVRLPTVSTDTDDDHFGYDLNITSEWTPYLVPFSELLQQGFGEEQVFDPAEVLEIQFALPPLETDLDIWVDDIAFQEVVP